ncbi:hypothetical protein C9374_000754 [Naegleria lovaniensis]|uniref:DUF4116 domain-containing protein n=1 Tax=Naegleria lovaniensis TaxID=51637 RepID=A0AA88GYB3_NAELO|nr:uncharacterized protein C9374_013633 [Naegleria lovaniensis]XP_044551896.1 uncharacterized protein C9374_000754 [Naegleria lovaniensis]KAG2372678.1 hypothetical protein C9374_013633 [Naegleria lovaniensis]KAG2387904.1 hypothetical protein C9374_000754 [Naegleria lovaniensis]
MKRAAPCHYNSVLKHKSPKLNNHLVTINLIDFHHLVESSPNTISCAFLNFLYQRLKTKFENQSKGFSKYLQTRHQWIQQNRDIPIEFMNDREYVENYGATRSSFGHEVQWLTQRMGVSELFENNQKQAEVIGNIEFWRPFKIGILQLVASERLTILKFVPKALLLEWKVELSIIFPRYYDFNFLFDLDDFDQAKLALGDGRCLLAQLSERLRDNEEMVMHAIRCNPSKNCTLYASERLKQDRRFSMQSLRFYADNDSWLPIELENDKEFILELLNTPITDMYGNIQEDMIQSCVPQLIDKLPTSILNELPVNVKLHVFLQSFLKDVWCQSLKDVWKEGLQILYELPDEYYRVHTNYQQRKQLRRGRFATSMNNVLENDPLKTLWEQVLTRMYKYDCAAEDFLDEECFWRREDWELFFQFAPLEMRNDRNFAIQAVKAHGLFFHHILPKFQNDRQFVLKVLDAHGNLLNDVLEHFLNDKQVILTALQSRNPCSFSDIPTQFHDDRDCFWAAIENNACYVSDALEIFQRFFEPSDREGIIDIIKRNGKVFMHVPGHLLMDADFILQCVKANPTIVDRILSAKVLLTSEIVTECMKYCGTITEKLTLFLKKSHKVQLVQKLTFHEAVTLFKDLKKKRLELEYCGCDIPESYLLKEPIQVLDVPEVSLRLDLGRVWDPLSRGRTYLKWKDYLFGNATWESFFERNDPSV